MEVTFFSDDLEQFLYSLDPIESMKMTRITDLIEECGHRIGMPYSKPVGHELFELRIWGERQIRFLYVFFRGRIVILYGFIKKDWKISRKSMQIALKRKQILFNS